MKLSSHHFFLLSTINFPYYLNETNSIHLINSTNRFYLSLLIKAATNFLKTHPFALKHCHTKFKRSHVPLKRNQIIRCSLHLSCNTTGALFAIYLNSLVSTCRVHFLRFPPLPSAPNGCENATAYPGDLLSFYFVLTLFKANNRALATCDDTL